MPGFPTDPRIWVLIAAVARKSKNLDDFMERTRTFIGNYYPEYLTDEAWIELQNSFAALDEPSKVAMGDQGGWTTDISSTTVSPALGKGYVSPDIYVAEKLVTPFMKGGEWFAEINTMIHNRSTEAKLCRPRVIDMLTREVWVGPPIKLDPDGSGMWLGYKIKLKPPAVGNADETDHTLVFTSEIME